MKELFYRETSDSFYLLYMHKLSKYINENNLHTISKDFVKSFFDHKNEQNFLKYRLYILKKWILKNERYTQDFVNMLDANINKLFLTNHLNSFERQYINNIQAITFAKKRNLKQLICDFCPNRNEIVFYKFLDVQFWSINNDQVKKIGDDFECFISSQRIILSKNCDLYNLKFELIDHFKFSSERIDFYMKNKNIYRIEAKYNYVFYASLVRILKLVKINI